LSDAHYILCLETSSAVCSVALGCGGRLLGFKESADPNSHGKRLAVFIEELLRESAIKIEQISAVAVSAGPGSYTGLRIGMATAKGLCFGLNIPLIAISTTESMVHSFLQKERPEAGGLLVPMVDARRLEVFTRVFDHEGKPISEPMNYISGQDGLLPAECTGRVHLFGSGAEKMKSGFKDVDVVVYPESYVHAENLLELAYSRMESGAFDSPAYTVPFYGKEWQKG
jgi:tRNA threonylcarbamoyladenosine biosynthesis protein TsaB